MGAYSPLADVPDELVAEVIARFHRPALAELARRGMPFVGALYAGLILTADRGPVLLEFNARFGDPETQAILPRLACPLAPLLLAAAVGRLRDVAASLGVTRDVLPAEPAAAVAIVLASRDYPTGPSTGDRIEGLAAAARDALVFHAGTRRAADGGWETDGGRILAVVGRGDGLPAARAAAEAAASLVTSSARDDVTTSARAVGSRLPLPPRRHRPAPEWGHCRDPPLHALGDGCGVVGRGPLRGHAARRDRGGEGAGGARHDPGRGSGGPPRAGPGRCDPIAAIERTTDHDASLRQPGREAVGPEGRYITRADEQRRRRHRARAQLRAAGDLLLRGVDGLLRALVARARAEAGTLMMGRTHSVHAEPTTLGHKLAGWAFELERDRVRLARAFADAATGKVSGPVGTYSHLPPDLEAEVLADLGLAVDPVSTQIVQRDRHAAVLAAIAITGGSLERFATEVPTSSTLNQRALEPFRNGQKGSSACPTSATESSPSGSRGSPACSALRRAAVREPAALARAGHQQLVGGARAPARLHHLLDYMLAKRRRSSRPGRPRRRMRENIERGSGSTPAAGSWWPSRGRRDGPRGRLRDRPANALRAADARVLLHALLADGPGSRWAPDAGRLDAASTTPVTAPRAAVIGRLDAIESGLRARAAGEAAEPAGEEVARAQG